MIPHTLLLFLCALTLCATEAFSQVRLPNLISDGMVLQRGHEIVIWGWASPGERITILFGGRQRRVAATSDGHWRTEFPAMSAGGPHTMKISGRNKIELKNILIGDVWLCAGQSNMVHQMNIHDVLYAEDIVNANNPAIRHFKIPTQARLAGPAEDLEGGQWQSAIGDEVRPFSAVAYFFARKLYDKYQVPIGLVNASVGGTPVESWMSEEGLKGFPEVLTAVHRNRDTAYIRSLPRPPLDDDLKRSRQPSDKGLTASLPWYALQYSPRNWRTITIPGYWEDQGARDLNGVVWYRRAITIPKGMVGKPSKLFLGRIVDADKVYLNGREIGSTTYQYPQRRYSIPEGLLKSGENILVVRVTNFDGKGGFVPDKPYYLFADKDTVDLMGYWQYKVGAVFQQQTPASSGLNAQNEPTALYNGMIAPLTVFPMKGILWYQGESNTGRPMVYADLLKALIRDWRRKFDHPDMPFIYAQLPNFMDVTYLPSESNWAVLRESQLKALTLPATGMTVNIDLGEWNDIHPDNKKDVGERMALVAQKLAYQDDVVFSGPIYRDHRIDGNKVVISFTQIGSGLITKDGEALSEFAIAGADKKFVWAEARIEGDVVVVWSDDIADPKFVRYAWADNPDNPNLYNKEGLPASPFRIGEP